MYQEMLDAEKIMAELPIAEKRRLSVLNFLSVNFESVIDVFPITKEVDGKQVLHGWQITITVPETTMEDWLEKYTPKRIDQNIREYLESRGYLKPAIEKKKSLPDSATIKE